MFCFSSRVFACCFLLVWVLASTRGRGDEEIDKIITSNLRRTANYDGLLFKYTSTHSKGKEPPITLENELTIFKPLAAGSRIFRRMWIARQKNPGEMWDPDDEYLVHQFCGFDGVEGRVFNRQYSGKMKRSIRHSSSVMIEDPAFYHDNQFEIFLTAGPHLFTQYEDPLGRGAKKHPIVFGVKEKVAWNGRNAIRLFWKGSPPGQGFDVLLDVDGGFIPVAVETRAQGKTASVLVTERLAEFQGIVYPSSGSLKTEPVGKLEPEYYEFKVSSVKRVTPEDVFWPDWPLGTAASNSAGELVVNLPYPPERREAIRNTTKRPATPSYRLIVSITVMVGAILLAWYRRRRSR